MAAGVLSFETPIIETKGSATIREQDPVIAKTTKIIAIWKFDSIPHFSFSFFTSVSHIVGVYIVICNVWVMKTLHKTYRMPAYTAMKTQNRFTNNTVNVNKTLNLCNFANFFSSPVSFALLVAGIIALHTIPLKKVIPPTT